MAMLVLLMVRSVKFRSEILSTLDTVTTAATTTRTAPIIQNVFTGLKNRPTAHGAPIFSGASRNSRRAYRRQLCQVTEYESSRYCHQPKALGHTLNLDPARSPSASREPNAHGIFSMIPATPKSGIKAVSLKVKIHSPMSRTILGTWVFFTEPFKEEAAMFWFGKVTVGPESGDRFGLAGNGRTVNLAQSGLGFLLAPLHTECVEEILA
jgi:hypothetical protein